MDVSTVGHVSKMEDPIWNRNFKEKLFTHLSSFVKVVYDYMHVHSYFEDTKGKTETDFPYKII